MASVSGSVQRHAYLLYVTVVCMLSRDYPATLNDPNVGKITPYGKNFGVMQRCIQKRFLSASRLARYTIHSIYVG